MRHLRLCLCKALERDAALVRTGASAAVAYGWDELVLAADLSCLEAYLPQKAFAALQERLNQPDVDGAHDDQELAEPVLLGVVDELWPFPPNYPIAPQPRAALDLLDYPHQAARCMGGEVLK